MYFGHGISQTTQKIIVPLAITSIALVAVETDEDIADRDRWSFRSDNPGFRTRTIATVARIDQIA